MCACVCVSVYVCMQHMFGKTAVDRVETNTRTDSKTCVSVTKCAHAVHRHTDTKVFFLRGKGSRSGGVGGEEGRRESLLQTIRRHQRGQSDRLLLFVFCKVFISTSVRHMKRDTQQGRGGHALVETGNRRHRGGVTESKSQVSQ